jgi:ribonucleoside-diphosphate reductase alpha chain
MIQVRRFLTTPDTSPFSGEWVLRDAVIKDYKKKGADGTPGIAFQQLGVEFPASWSQQAVEIVSSKYFRGKLGTPERETSLKQVIGRVAKWLKEQGIKQGYFDEETGKVFEDEISAVVVNQLGTFNSPVWFNVGVFDKPQCSACFILEVEDSMESILDWVRLEGMIFKGGSGSGVSLGRLRSSEESLSSGGKSSGPMSFAKGADAMAGAIKSGGKTRRAAKMLVLPVDHLDIEKFVDCKVHEERKAKALKQAGFDITLDGDEVFYQNANNSVRVTDEFMEAVVEGEKFTLRGVVDPVTREVDAKALMLKIAQAAWECGDPGLQYDTTINKWHTSHATGRINASNPCSEYMFVDNSACNLASINLVKFLRSDGTFDTEKFKHVVDLFILAQDIIVDGSAYPSTEIAENSHRLRPLGLGYANLGSLLMRKGLPYDSAAGRAYAASITALMHGRAYRQSAELADAVGPFEGLNDVFPTPLGAFDSNSLWPHPSWVSNRNNMLAVIAKHKDAADDIASGTMAGVDPALLKEAKAALDEAFTLAGIHGVRNGQVTVLAPTGTISFMMDCDTTGCEPNIQMVAMKSLVGGGTMSIVYPATEEVLKNKYTAEQAKAISDYIISTGGRIKGAPFLKEEDYPLFDTALGWKNRETGEVENALSPMAHIKMMAAIQPFLSGAISKTVNMPESSTVEDIFDVYVASWKLGLKSLALYRDNCKSVQPLTAQDEAMDDDSESSEDYEIVKWPLPDERPAVTTKFSIGGDDGFKGYLTVGVYPDTNRPGEVFMKGAKEGSTISGFIDCFATAVSIGLQYGVPIEKFIKTFKGTTFEPRGFTGRDDIRSCSSIPDFMFKWIEKTFLKGSVVKVDVVALNCATPKPVFIPKIPMPWEKPETEQHHHAHDAVFIQHELGLNEEKTDDLCPSCGGTLVRSGTCKRCLNCFSQSGCG